MKKIIYKIFSTWNFDKKEKWLNEMADKGLCLVSVGFCKYEFEDCKPGEYTICSQLLDSAPHDSKSKKYIEFLESTGVEHICSFSRWVYFRKKSADGAFELFSDNTSRIKHLSKIIASVIPIAILNLFLGIENLFIVISSSSWINYVGIINIALSIWMTFGSLKLIKKRKKLKQQSQLFE